MMYPNLASHGHVVVPRCAHHADLTRCFLRLTTSSSSTLAALSSPPPRPHHHSCATRCLPNLAFGGRRTIEIHSLIYIQFSHIINLCPHYNVFYSIISNYHLIFFSSPLIFFSLFCVFFFLSSFSSSLSFPPFLSADCPSRSRPPLPFQSPPPPSPLCSPPLLRPPIPVSSAPQ